MRSLTLWSLYALAGIVYIEYFSDAEHPFESMVAMLIGSAIAFVLVEIVSHLISRVSFYFWKRKQDASSPSPTIQGCTPEGGVSAYGADDNSTGGVTAPEVTWRASGSHSNGGAHE